MCIYDVVLFPVLLVSLIEEDWHVALAITMLWTFDMLMSCLTGYYTPDGGVETRIPLIVRKYLTTWFMFDAVLVGVDWTGYFFVRSSGGPFRAIKSSFRVIRVVRVLRIVRLYPKLQDQLGHVNSERFFTAMRLAGYISLVVLANHYVACVWCAFWNLDRPTIASPAYLAAMHWSLSHSMLGSMDIAPENNAERFFTCIMLVLSLVVFSTLLSTITSDTTRLRMLSEESARKVRVVRRFFLENTLPPQLTCNVWHFIKKNKLTASARVKPSSVEMFEMLPPHIVREIRYETFIPVLREHPLFDAYDKLEPEAIKMLCSSGITQLTVSPQEQILWPTPQGVNRMLFVVRGCLEYHPIELHGQVFTILPREWALEETLWAKYPKLNGTLAAGNSPTELVLVSPGDFREVARIFPKTLRKLMRYGQRFVQVFNARCKSFDNTEADPLFSNPESIHDLLNDINIHSEPAQVAVVSLASTKPLRDLARNYNREKMVICSSESMAS